MIELLVVIAIISVLAAILFPVFAQAREKARQGACLSNVRQVGAAALQYVQDFDETWPVTRPITAAGTNAGPSELYPASDTFTTPSPQTRSFWANALEPYLKSWAVHACPSGEDFLRDPAEPESALGAARFSYAMNAYLNCYPDGEIAQPAETATFVELPKTRRVRKYIPIFPLAFQFSNAPEPVPWRVREFTNSIEPDYAFWNRAASWWVHAEGGNQAYADGHARWVRHPSRESLWAVSGDRGRMPVTPSAVNHPAGNRFWFRPLGPFKK